VDKLQCSDRKAMTSTNLLHKVEMTYVVSSNQEFVHRRNGENVKVLLIAGILHLR